MKILKALAGTPWHASSWALSAAIIMLSVGVNILTHVDNPREIRQFIGGMLVCYAIGIAGVITLQILITHDDKQEDTR
jgi:uncharacterized membrane protein YccC